MRIRYAFYGQVFKIDVHKAKRKQIYRLLALVGSLPRIKTPSLRVEPASAPKTRFKVYRLLMVIKIGLPFTFPKGYMNERGPRKRNAVCAPVCDQDQTAVHSSVCEGIALGSLTYRNSSEVVTQVCNP